MKSKKTKIFLIIIAIVLGYFIYQQFAVNDRDNGKTFMNKRLGIKFDYSSGLACKIKSKGSSIHCLGNNLENSELITVFIKPTDESEEEAVRKLTQDRAECFVEYNEEDLSWSILDRSQEIPEEFTHELLLEIEKRNIEICGQYVTTPFSKNRFMFYSETPNKFIFLKQPWMSLPFWNEETIEIW